MKHILFFILIFLSGGVVFSQAPTGMAEKIAKRMMDSLHLSSSQYDQIYSINTQIQSRKMTVRGQYSNADSVRRKMQAIENTRDVLYQAVLPSDKYILYRQQKTAIINNN